MWEICEECGAIVGDPNMHATTHPKPTPTSLRLIDVKETQNAHY